MRRYLRDGKKSGGSEEGRAVVAAPSSVRSEIRSLTLSQQYDRRSLVCQRLQAVFCSAAGPGSRRHFQGITSIAVLFGVMIIFHDVKSRETKMRRI